MAKKAGKPTSSATVADVLRGVSDVAPLHLAESWDNVGLQIGTAARPAGRVMVALEVTRDVILEAAKRGVSTLVTHHPLIFRPLKSLVEDTYASELTAEVIRHNLSLIVAHTNLDCVANGTNGELADRLGLQAAGRRFLRPVPPDRDKFIYVVFVPRTHVEVVINAIASAGAGVIGDYSHCTFRSPGTGTYIPMEGANPYQGSVGKLEQAEEVRLECLCPKNRITDLLKAVRAVHPYETIAFHLYEADVVEKPVAGLGLIGNLPEPSSIETLARRAKKSLGVKTIGVVGDPAARVERVALCSGAGGEFIRNWRTATADLFVTGEMNHHDCIEALHRGIPTLLVGHWASEIIVCQRFATLITHALEERGVSGVEVLASESEQDPVRYI